MTHFDEMKDSDMKSSRWWLILTGQSGHIFLWV